MASAKRKAAQSAERRSQPAVAIAFLRCATFATLMLVQSFEVVSGPRLLLDSPFWVVRPLGWALLFALAGHRLTASIARHGPRAFALNRLVRAWPPLAVSVAICALVIGPLATRSSLGSYVMAPEFRLWFLNLMAVPRFTLPGVFELNIQPYTVNGVYWAAPVYLALVATAAIHGNGDGLRRAAPALAAIIAIGISGLFVSRDSEFLIDSGLSHAEAIGFPLLAFLSGAAGMVAGRHRHNRVQRRIGGLLTVGGVIAIGIFGDRDWAGDAVFCIGIAVGAVALIHSVRARGSIRRLDQEAQRWVPVAYLAFLIAYPAQQVAAVYGPAHQGPITNFILAVPTTGIICLAIALALRSGLRRLGLGPALGDVAHPIDKVALPRFTRRWWIAQMRRTMIVIGIVMLVSLVALGTLVVVMTAMQRDLGGA